jgi:hypothetical protein
MAMTAPLVLLNVSSGPSPMVPEIATPRSLTGGQWLSGQCRRLQHTFSAIADATVLLEVSRIVSRLNSRCLVHLDWKQEHQAAVSFLSGSLEVCFPFSQCYPSTRIEYPQIAELSTPGNNLLLAAGAALSRSQQ